MSARASSEATLKRYVREAKELSIKGNPYGNSELKVQ